MNSPNWHAVMKTTEVTKGREAWWQRFTATGYCEHCGIEFPLNGRARDATYCLACIDLARERTCEDCGKKYTAIDYRFCGSCCKKRKGLMRA